MAYRLRISALIPVFLASLLIMLLPGCRSSQTALSLSHTESFHELVSEKRFDVNQVTVKSLDIAAQIPLKSGESLSNEHYANGNLYIQVINRPYNWLFPTAGQYKYNLENQQVSLIKERDITSNERVMDFLEYQGVLYETIVSMEGDQLTGSVLADGYPVAKGLLQSAASAPYFASDGQNLYVLSRFVVDGEVVDEIDQVIDQTSLAALWQSDAQSGLIQANTFINHKDEQAQLIFQTTTHDLYRIQGDDVRSVRCPQAFVRLQSLGDQVIGMSLDSRDSTVVNYTLFKMEDLSQSSLSSIDHSIGIKITGAGGGDTFLYADLQGNTALARLEGEEILTQKLFDVFPGISSYWRTGESQALVYERELIDGQTSEIPHYYLIDMKERE